MTTQDAAHSAGEMEQTLNVAFKKITDLLEDIGWMLNELQRKDSGYHSQVPFPEVDQLAGDLTDW